MYICLFFERYLYLLKNFRIYGETIKRSVVLHGNSTLTLSLPSKWIKTFGIKKGDTLDINEQGRNIVISTTNSIEHEKKELDIKNRKRLGKSFITSCYRSGYDEITLKYSDPEYIETIYTLIAKETTGFEVVRQSSNECTIQDITGQAKDEFEVAIRRLWLLTIEIADETIKIISGEEKEKSNKLDLMDAIINKFSNYCIRILNKKGRQEQGKTAVYYHFVRSLEILADNYKELSKLSASDKDIPNKECIQFLKDTNLCLKKMHTCFFKFDEDKMEELYADTKALQGKTIEKGISRQNMNLCIIITIRNMLSTIVEINN